jgi:hypothetical protein
MKLLAILSLLGTGTLLLGACQSSPPSNTFNQTTHRTYNPETGSFEQSPPFGKQSNKSESSTGQ